MVKQALISVVIPAFNAERYLQRTLCSVVSQTYPNFEVLIVDDGSNDDTNLIAREFAAKHPNVAVLRIPNGGVAKARNAGIQAAQGEFLAFLDADDLWHPEKLAFQMEAILTSPWKDAAAVYTRMRIIDEDDCTIRNGSGIGSTGYTFTRHLYTRPVGNCSSLLVRRRVAEEIGGFDPSWLQRGMGGCEDLDFELKVAARYPLISLPQFLVGYRSHPHNMSNDRLALVRSVLPTVEHHLSLHPRLPRWAVRKVRASALEYALQLLALNSNWRQFVLRLARLYRVDLPRAISYTLRFSLRKLVRDGLSINRQSHNFPVRPSFQELDPEEHAGPRLKFRRKRRRKKLLEAFSELDRAWLKEDGYR